MKFANIKTGIRLALGFGLVIFLTLAMGVGSMFILNKIGDLSEKLYNHPYAVRGAVKDIRNGISAMRNSMKDVALAAGDLQVLEAATSINTYEKKVYESFDLVFARFLGSQEDVRLAHQTFADWKAIRAEILHLVQEGKKAEATEEITRGSGAAHIVKLESLIHRLEDFAENKAATFFAENVATKKKAIFTIAFLLAAIITSGIVVSVLITRSIIMPLRRMITSLDTVSASGDLEAVRLPIDRHDEMGDLAGSVARLIETLKNTAKQANIIASGDYSATIAPQSAKDDLGLALQTMTESLRHTSQQNATSTWLKNGQVLLNERLRGELTVLQVADVIVRFVSEYLKAQVGALYFATEGDSFKLFASYAYTFRKGLAVEFRLGEGLVGQAALEKKTMVISPVPDDHLKIISGLGESRPLNILVCPFISNTTVRAVLELASFSEFSATELKFIEDIAEFLAIAITSAESRERLQEMLEKTQQQAEELESQQEELRVANEELEGQAVELKNSQAELQSQQEELRVINEELQEKTDSLEKQQAEIEERNSLLMEARKGIEKKAADLEIAGKYKSEFLANMSHELRTPLNSLLLLSDSLASNREKNLTDDQVESAQIINSSGRELLNLINEILDLSKVEAGKMELMIEECTVDSVVANIRRQFQRLADEKNLSLTFTVAPEVPERIVTDQHRLEQILKNLLSNALKFTKEGGISVTFDHPPKATLPPTTLLPAQAISITVHDTGIGIKAENQQSIFQAFQQEDGSTARRFGGTGLGLSISTGLARLLGGEIQLQSEPGVGSTFTLCLPLALHKDPVAKKPPGQERPVFQSTSAPATSSQLHAAPRSNPQPAAPVKRSPFAFHFTDDRDALKPNDKVIMVIEDDENFARILFKECHAKNFKCILSPEGEEGIALIEKYAPAAVILDINLPGDLSGWDVLEHVKKSSHLRHIPVHMMSAEQATIDAMQRGAIAFLTKPISAEDLQSAFAGIENIINRDIGKLLVVEDNDVLRKQVVLLLGDGDVETQEAVNGREALEAIRRTRFDCVVLDLGLPDMSGFDLLDRLETENIAIPPVVIYTGRDLSREEDEKLRHYTESIIIKGVKSVERLLDETALFLHRIVEKMPEKKRKMIASLHEQDQMFAGKKLLLVDDDMRNTFALAKILKEKHFEVLIASDGQQALELLDKTDNIDLVLMDIMMPVMDGYATMQHIRKQEKLWNLPIIALTAKAMQEDREECIKAGASDYLSKPVDIQRLLSMMRVWLYR